MNLNQMNYRTALVNRKLIFSATHLNEDSLSCSGISSIELQWNSVVACCSRIQSVGVQLEFSRSSVGAQLELSWNWLEPSQLRRNKIKDIKTSPWIARLVSVVRLRFMRVLSSTPEHNICYK